jgi:hypothetical protein
MDTRNLIQNECRNAALIPLFKKGDRRETNNYRGIGILNTCCNVSSIILNTKLQRYSKQFMTEAQNGFPKGRSCTLLIVKRRECN